MREGGLSVDCVEAGEVGGLESYDAVVLGSAVYMKRWGGDAEHVLRRHGKELSERPFWVFSSGPIGDPSHDDPRGRNHAGSLRRRRPSGPRARDIRRWVPTDPHRPGQHATVENTPREYRDRREWDEIRTWASRIAAELG